ncbi:sodium/potassium/calcium exchanger 4-like [Glandiceps talaboti]
MDTGTVSNVSDGGNCTSVGTVNSSLPVGIFTEEQLRNGAIAIPVLVLVYSLYGLMISCDRYFVAAMERICERLNLQEDVAGATFMAFGSSAPEFLTTLISVLIGSGDIGYGTVIGSAAFNVLLIPGVCGLITVGTLQWWPIMRDSAYYALGVGVIIIMIIDMVIQWYESLILVLMYSGYILLMYHNRYLSEVVPPEVESRLCCIQQDSTEKESNHLNSINNTYNSVDGDVTEPGMNGTNRDQNQIEASKTEEDEKPVQYYSPFTIPDSFFDRFLCVSGFPMHFAMYLTTPNCRRPEWANWYIVTFLTSTVWMGVFCYISIWMVKIIGYVAGIPHVIMGLTFLAIGSSLPDLILSILVAREGHIDMALANAIGSNVFDILVCLGLPALISGIINTMAGTPPFVIDSIALMYITIMLLIAIALNAFFIGLNGWKLTKKLGVLLLFLYVVYIGVSVILAYVMILTPNC